MKAELIDAMGSDLTVVNAARVSFDKESEWEGECPPLGRCADHTLSEKDTKLIRYLAKHGHWTPFSHPQITMRETVPIFVARQRFRHTVGFTYNEMSRRYVDDAPEFYKSTWRERPDKSLKQGSGGPLPKEAQDRCNLLYDRAEFEALTAYNDLLKEGVAPEQARVVLPQSMYTSYYVTGSLAAWARAYNLREDPTKAQSEIADLAHQWDKIIYPLFPISWEALVI